MSSPKGIALVGGGIFIKEQHLPAVLATPLLSLKAIYSRSLKSAQSTLDLVPKEHSPVDLYSDDSGAGKSYKDLLTREDIYGVIIALPIKNQPEFIEAALLAGKHVFAEKPVGPTAEAAKKQIDWYHSIADEKRVTWAIAEQVRFVPKFAWAAAEARKLGKVIGFHFKVFFHIGLDNKYLATEWRKSPTHPYGFILDGGVHWIASARLLLGDDTPQSVIAYSSLAQDYLPPVDTVSGVIKTKSGAIGTFNASCGTTLSSNEYSVACENGSVTIEGDKGWIRYKDGRKEERELEFVGGVKEEVAAWAEALTSGKPNPLQTPEEALKDLELLEAMLKSGDANGAPQVLKHQNL